MFSLVTILTSLSKVPFVSKLLPYWKWIVGGLIVVFIGYLLFLIYDLKKDYSELNTRCEFAQIELQRMEEKLQSATILIEDQKISITAAEKLAKDCLANRIKDQLLESKRQEIFDEVVEEDKMEEKIDQKNKGVIVNDTTRNKAIDFLNIY
jgi:hypothetical protein